MRDSLFRPEALESFRADPRGHVSVICPPRFFLLTVFFAALAVAVVSYIWFGQVTRKANVSGYLVPSKGLIKVYAPEAGTLVQQNVAEGSKVKPGDPLFILATERSSHENAQARADSIALLKQRQTKLQHDITLQTQLDGEQTHALEQRRESMTREIRSMDLAIETLRQRVAYAKGQAGLFNHLLQDQFVSRLQAEQKHDQLLERTSELQALERQYLQLRRERDHIQLELQSHTINTAKRRAEIERSILALEQELTEQRVERDIVVRAPAAGTITSILAVTGQFTQTAAAVLSILPEDTQLIAHLLVPSRSIGFVTSRQEVALRYEAFPYQRFGSFHGNVVEISKTLLSPSDIRDLPISLREPAYRVTVALSEQSISAYHTRIPLQAGMVLEAGIALDRRRLVEWIVDPLLAVSGRV